MSRIVIWRLMFRVNDERAANKCLSRAIEAIPATVVESPRPYWKIPELWEMTLQSEFESPVPNGVLETLLAADRIGSDWTVSGPLLVDEEVSVFEGIFNAGPARPHVAGLHWASFSVSEIRKIER